MADILTDMQWELLKHLLPPPKRRGRRRSGGRNILNGILYVLRTGCRWEDVPNEYGGSVTCWRRWAQWQANGTWERIWRAYLQTLNDQQKVDWAVAFVDGRFGPAKWGERHRIDQEGEGLNVDASDR